MPVGSRLHVNWLDFCVYLSAFEGSVYRGASKKMDYHTWRKLKYDRKNETQVIIEKCSNSFIVIIGHEDEYHTFWRGDESFGDFLFENLIDVKEYDHDWNECKMPLSNSLNVPIPEALAITKDVAIDCGEALKSSLAITKDKLASIGVMPITADAGPSISCVIDTKVDKAEFDSKLEALSNSIKAVADKYNNIDKKEISTMKGFNFDFGPVNPATVRMSLYGLAVKNKAGTWVSYDAKTGDIMDVDILNFDGAKFLYKMPVAIKDIDIGDVVIHNGIPMFVIAIAISGAYITAVDPINGERKDIMLPKSPFGFNFATKVVNFLGNTFNTSAIAENPFGNMWMLMAMSGENKDMNDILPFLMLNNATPGIDNNVLMFMALSNTKGGSKDMLPWLMMLNAQNPVVNVPSQGCTCGGHCTDNHTQG